MFGGSGVSLADIAAVTNRDGNNDGFGGNNGVWVLIILFALFGGWGNNGYGNNRGGNGNGDNCGTTIVTVPTGGYGMGGYGYGGGFMEATVQRGFDNQAVISKLDGLNSGLCSLGYDQLAQMNGLGNTVMQTGWGIQQAINTQGIAAMQNANALSRQVGDCCCENRQGQAELRYTMASDTCAITTAIKDAVRDINENANANYRDLYNQQVNIQMEALKEHSREQASMIQALTLAQSQANQNQYFDSKINALVDRLDPRPRPAYWVQDPNCCRNPWEQLNNRGCGTCCNG